MIDTCFEFHGCDDLCQATAEKSNELGTLQENLIWGDPVRVTLTMNKYQGIVLKMSMLESLGLSVETRLHADDVKTLIKLLSTATQQQPTKDTK